MVKAEEKVINLNQRKRQANINNTAEDCTVLTTRQEVIEEIEQYAFSWLIILNNNSFGTKAYTYSSIRMLFENNELEPWLKESWNNQTIAIFIP